MIKKKKQIVITTNGFVFIGNVDKRAKETIITEAYNIRRWGTTKGLGEIALTGPTSSTILDDYGIVVIPAHAIIYVIQCRV